MLFLQLPQKDEIETSIWSMNCETVIEAIFYYFMWYLLSKYLIYEFSLEFIACKKLSFFINFFSGQENYNLSGFPIILAAGELRCKFCM